MVKISFFKPVKGIFVFLPILTSLVEKHHLPLEEQKLLRQSLQTLALNVYWRNEHNLPINRWSLKNRDCAGFVRYLLWEAYQKHDERWQEQEGSKLTRDLPALSGKMPKLYPKGYVSASLLIQNNTRYLGKDIRQIYFRTGDLLYFRQSDGADHLMLIIEDKKEILLIYHTGKPKNEIRLIKLDDLFAHESRWHPGVGNPYFKGVYRFYFFE